MIELHSFGTPNGIKISVLLEELGIPYEPYLVNIMKDDQFKPEFLKISPNNKIPAIVDTEGPNGERHSVFESGAIMIYLAEKYGKFYPSDPVARSQTLQWLFFQVGSVGPMMGQAGHFARFAKEDIPYAKDRYLNETKRILGVMEKQLSNNAYIAGDEYTIADMAIVPWIAALSFYGVESILEPFPHVNAWVEKVRARPAVQRGWQIEYKPS